MFQVTAPLSNVEKKILLRCKRNSYAVNVARSPGKIDTALVLWNLPSTTGRHIPNSYRASKPEGSSHIKGSATHKHLPYQARLSKIQRNVADTLYPACKTEEETTTHMISACAVYDPERQALLLRFPANETSELGKLSKTQQSTAVTRLILLGITIQGKTEAVDFHKITLQYILGIHHARLQFL